jgi:hypothetical protein
MKGDDGGDSGEAELEAGSRQCFRPEQEHDDGADRHQPEADRLAPQRYPAKHKQSCDTASYRRNLRSRKQSVSDPGDRSNQDQIQAKRQSLAEGQQLQGEEHGRANHCCDVKPANGEKVRETAAAHGIGIVFGNRVLVARNERGCDTSG